jgi:hypothetical protein
MQEHHNSKNLVHGQYENSLKRQGRNNNEGQSQYSHLKRIEFHEIEATSGNKNHISLTKDIRPCRETHSTSAKVSMRKVRFALEMSTTGNGN